jgi:hypothetical protein
MTKLPTRSPTHEDIEMRRLASMGLELEDIATDEVVELSAVIELAEDRGRPASHYIAAIPLASELRLASGNAALALRVCAGTCQRYGALDLLDHAVERWSKQPSFTITAVSCLDRCDQAPACELHGDHGALVLAPATKTTLDEAIGELAK